MSHEKKKTMVQEDIDPEYVVGVDSDLNLYGDDNNSVQQVPAQRRRSRLGVSTVFADINQETLDGSPSKPRQLCITGEVRRPWLPRAACHHEHTLLRFSTV